VSRSEEPSRTASGPHSYGSSPGTQRCQVPEHHDPRGDLPDHDRLRGRGPEDHLDRGAARGDAAVLASERVDPNRRVRPGPLSQRTWREGELLHPCRGPSAGVEDSAEVSVPSLTGCSWPGAPGEGAAGSDVLGPGDGAGGSSRSKSPRSTGMSTATAPMRLAIAAIHFSLRQGIPRRGLASPEAAAPRGVPPGSGASPGSGVSPRGVCPPAPLTCPSISPGPALPRVPRSQGRQRIAGTAGPRTGGTAPQRPRVRRARAAHGRPAPRAGTARAAGAGVREDSPARRWQRRALGP
jgi:hypothetical protein